MSAAGHYLVVAVTGGRDFTLGWFVRDRLDWIQTRLRPITRLAHGACPTGVDAAADQWGREKLTAPHVVVPYPADWSAGRKGGPLRNRAMLQREQPDLLLAFPGGKGTADCIAAARSFLIPVVQVWPVGEWPETRA